MRALLRCLLGQEPSDSGSISFGTGVEPAYFDQRLDEVGGELLPVDVVRPANRELPLTQRRDVLARFGIVGEMAEQPITSLSGGERNRVVLAKLAASGANLLFLDEPTNHLDLWACERLEESIRNFAGTVVIVSHDRYFLNQVVDHMIVLGPAGWKLVHGNYDQYHRGQGEAEPTGTAAAGDSSSLSRTTKADRGGRSKPTNKLTDKATDKPTDKPRRKRKFPYRKLEAIEDDIVAQEAEIETLHNLLADPAVLRDGVRVRELQLQLGEKQATLAQLYEHWEEAAE